MGKMEYRFILAVAVAVVAGVRGECPADFFQLEEGCYHYSAEAVVREEAYNYCLGLGATLAAFETCTDITDIARYLNAANIGTGGIDFWTAASRTGDIWEWTDNPSPLVYGAPWFDPLALASNTTDCAIMPDKGGYLQPADCTLTAYPMCESPVVRDGSKVVRKTPKVECPDPFTAVGDRCFYINQAFLTWEGARQSCKDVAPDLFVDLAVLSNCNLFTETVRFLEASETGVSEWLWVGANDYQETGVFRWLSGDFISPGVPFWCPGQPNNFANNQNCAMLWGSNFYYGADEDCTSIHRSLCEIGV